MTYPRVMTHPNARKSDVKIYRNAKGGIDHADGGPDILPPVSVTNADEEEYYRSRGYRSQGDSMERQDPDLGFKRYPMWMAKKDVDDVLVHTFEEEKRMKAQGFHDKGKSNPSAFHQAVAAPALADYEPVPYPKWVGDVLVNSYEEEKALKKKVAPPPPPPHDPEVERKKEANRKAQSDRMKSFWARKREQIAAALTLEVPEGSSGL